MSLTRVVLQGMLHPPSWPRRRKSGRLEALQTWMLPTPASEPAEAPYVPHTVLWGTEKQTAAVAPLPPKSQANVSRGPRPPHCNWELCTEGMLGNVVPAQVSGYQFIPGTPAVLYLFQKLSVVHIYYYYYCQQHPSPSS